MNKSPCSSRCGLAAPGPGLRRRRPRGPGGDIIESPLPLTVVYHDSSAARDYILAACPRARQEARYPAGMLGDIQAVTWGYRHRLARFLAGRGSAVTVWQNFRRFLAGSLS